MQIDILSEIILNTYSPDGPSECQVFKSLDDLFSDLTSVVPFTILSAETIYGVLVSNGFKVMKVDGCYKWRLYERFENMD